jgi:CrcB protein
MTSGFCGSLTTFSGWQVQAAQTFLKPFVFIAFLNLIVGFTTFYCCFRFGRHLGLIIHAIMTYNSAKKEENAEIVEPPSNISFQPISLYQPENITMMVLAVCLWILFAILFVLVSNSRHWTGPAFFSPVGALIRWYSSQWSSAWPKFKIPTFSVNTIGTALYSVLLICNVKYGGSPKGVLSASLFSLLSGLCGTLTTVSTFVSELYNMSPKHFAYVYAISTIVVAQAVSILILSVSKFSFSVAV